MEVSDAHLLEIDSVELSFGMRRILSGVYLPVETGRVTALLGRNGSGKSCLMRILCGELRADFRSMRIDGVWRERFRADEVRYLPQAGFVPGRFTPRRVMRDFGIAWDDFETCFPRFGMLRDTPVGQMSGGERRVMECFAVLRSPTCFVLLDEPFSQVAPLDAERLGELILAEKRSKGILLTDHLYRHVVPLADRLYVLTEGCARRVERPDDLVRFGYLRDA